MDKYIGKRLDGRYLIKEIIGVGGMAYVYKAYDSVDDRTVAIKILKEEYLENADFTRRFKNESKAIAILSHPNIVKVLDVSFGDTLQYIVMEYIDGITLKEYIDQQKVIKWKETVHFTVQILRALQHAHDKGIVHRDIKPQNIMLLPDGTIKVTDFGIARFSRTDIRATALTDKAIGSVHYISPEQARGEVTDEKADIYSVGVMMYEMLTGQLPFEADNAVSVAIMQLQSEPKRPREIYPGIPEGLEDITIKAMQKDPAKRYQSAAEMLYDIDEFKRNPTIHFEYKYFVDETPTRFVEAITKVKGDAPAAGGNVLENEEEEKKGPPIVPILAAITGALVLAALLFVGVLFLMEFFNREDTTPEVVIPSFIGQKYTDVINNPENTRNFSFLYREGDSDTYEKGVVMDQTPTPGSTAKQSKQTITLTVSTGKQQVTVPDVRGKTQSEAETTLDRAGFVPDVHYEVSNEYDPGQVIRTDPAYPTKAELGSVVKVYVSGGTDPIEVPKVLNSTLEAAKIELQRSGFTKEPVIVYQNSSDPAYARAGIVMKQSPAEGEKVLPDYEITLYVSSGYHDLTGVYIALPEINETVQVQVYIDGILQTANEYTFPPMLPSVVGSVKLDFHEQKASYNVTVRIASQSGQKDIQFTVDGTKGEIVPGTWVDPPWGDTPAGPADPENPSEP